MKKIFILFIGLVILSTSNFAWFWEKKKGGNSIVSGQAFMPVENIYIYVYKEDSDLHGPPYAVSEPTDTNGGFKLELPDGSYFFAARKRTSGDQSGPVQQGDIKSDTIGPITVKNGNPVTLNINCFIKQGDEKSDAALLETGRTGISGTIRDTDGNPVEGVRIHVYTYVQMSERPKFVSVKTGPDGKYIVYLPQGGTYYLAARDKFGGPPQIGNLYGRYDQGTINPSAVIIKTDEIKKDIDIIVHKIW
ncbi:MAG: carboxypeptidase-like regulatory domain-containing protein [bacterium]